MPVSCQGVISSAGRASALQAEGRRFDPVITHHSSQLRDKQQPMQSLHCLPGAVVQLVRIPACHAGGRGFESRPLRHIFEAPIIPVPRPRLIDRLHGGFLVLAQSMNIEMLLVHRRLSLKKSFSRAGVRRRVEERREGKRHRLEQSSP